MVLNLFCGYINISLIVFGGILLLSMVCVGLVIVVDIFDLEYDWLIEIFLVIVWLIVI